MKLVCIDGYFLNCSFKVCVNHNIIMYTRSSAAVSDTKEQLLAIITKFKCHTRSATDVLLPPLVTDPLERESHFYFSRIF